MAISLCKLLTYFVPLLFWCIKPPVPFSGTGQIAPDGKLVFAVCPVVLSQAASLPGTTVIYILQLPLWYGCKFNAFLLVFKWKPLGRLTALKSCKSPSLLSNLLAAGHQEQVGLLRDCMITWALFPSKEHSKMLESILLCLCSCY